MANESYIKKKASPVLNKEDFFKNGTPEAPTLRKLDSAIKRLLVATDKNVILNVLEDNIGYRFDVFSSGNLKNEFTAQIYYFPQHRGIDIYDHNTIGTDKPLISYVNKRCVYKNFSVLLQILKVENLFNPLINIL